MTNLVRRGLLQSAVAASAGLALPARAAQGASAGALVPASDFPNCIGVTYLNAAQRHPLNRYAAKALQDYAEQNLRLPDGGVGSAAGPEDFAVLEAFARLINARPAEVAFVPSTLAAENMIAMALGFPAAKGAIVTDDLHYDGAIYLYEQMRQRGVDVRRIGQTGGRVPTEAIVAAIDEGVRLVSISLVSYANGFQHDLPAIVAAAHAKGALVYADLVQAAGAIPIDIKASGVDFAAAGTQKWLMGDKGLGFVYARQETLDAGRLNSPFHGWKQTQADHFPFFDDHGGRPAPASFDVRPGAVGQFEIGTYGLGPMAAAGAGLTYIERIGTPRIAAHAAALAAPLRATLPRLGYECLSPAEAPGHISTFRVTDRAATAARLAKANVKVRLAEGWMRASVSVYNTPADIEALIRALS